MGSRDWRADGREARPARLRATFTGGVDQIEEATPGFTIVNVRGYYTYSKNLSFIGGIDNLFDRNYQEHLDLRLLGPTPGIANPTRVLAPGISPYVGVQWTF